MVGHDQLVKEQVLRRLSLESPRNLACLSVGIGDSVPTDRCPDLLEKSNSCDGLIQYLGRVLECARLSGETECCTIRSVSLTEMECLLTPLYRCFRLEDDERSRYEFLLMKLKPLLSKFEKEEEFYIFLDGSPQFTGAAADETDEDARRAWSLYLKEQFSKLEFGCAVDATRRVEDISREILEVVRNVSKDRGVEQDGSEGSSSEYFSSNEDSEENPSPPLSPLLRQEMASPEKRARLGD